MRSGTVTSPECNVASADAHTIYLYKFAATHGAFFCVILVMLAVASVQSSGTKRHVMNTVNAVRDCEVHSHHASRVRRSDCLCTAGSHAEHRHTDQVMPESGRLHARRGPRSRHPRRDAGYRLQWFRVPETGASCDHPLGHLRVGRTSAAPDLSAPGQAERPHRRPRLPSRARLVPAQVPPGAPPAFACARLHSF